jgi:hypothetical protein
MANDLAQGEAFMVPAIRQQVALDSEGQMHIFMGHEWTEAVVGRTAGRLAEELAGPSP